jgi:two-component system nitrogen regulation sensor histidine kinase NtrY
MVFKNFYAVTIFRIILITGMLLLFVWCVINELYLRSVYMGVFSLCMILELFYFVTRFTKNIETFLVNIQQRDFSLHFPDQNSFGKLYSELNKITLAFKKISTEKEVHNRFLQTLFEHIKVSLVTFDERGKIHLVNKNFLLLIGKPGLTSLEELHKDREELAKTMRELKPEETRVIKFYRQRQLQNLAVQASEFKLEGIHYKLISAQNITNELNAKELEAWQKLIRVLTHEIMNSIAPIVSLSDTLHTAVENEKAQAEDKDLSFLKTLYAGLDAIKIRSQGLHSFTEAYRKLTRVPDPLFTTVDVRLFINQVIDLLRSEFEKRNIDLKVDVVSSWIKIDKQLMEQVILNLVWNAIDAVSETSNRTIKISALEIGGRIKISIADNGTGIEDANLDKIFVPFFTTKKNGSGIGLALARQIVQLHNGEVLIESKLNKGTTVTVLV